MLIVHLLITLIIGGGVGLLTRHLELGVGPMSLAWTITSGAIGALLIAASGAYIGIYELGDFIYYASAFTGGIIGVLIYNIAIAKE